MDVKPRRRVTARGVSPTPHINLTAPCGGTNSAGVKDPNNGAFQSRERAAKLLNPPPLRRGETLSPGTHIRRRPPSMPHRGVSPQLMRPNNGGGGGGGGGGVSVGVGVVSLRREALEHCADSLRAPSRHTRAARVTRLPADSHRHLRESPLASASASASGTAAVGEGASPTTGWGSPGVGRRNIVLDAKPLRSERRTVVSSTTATTATTATANGNANATTAGGLVSPTRSEVVRRYWQLCEDVGQAPHEAWMNAVLEGNGNNNSNGNNNNNGNDNSNGNNNSNGNGTVCKSRERETSTSELRPPLANGLSVEHSQPRATASAPVRLPKIRSAGARLSTITTTATTPTTEGPLWRRAAGVGGRGASAVRASPAKCSGGRASSILSSPKTISREPPVADASVEHMRAYCKHLQPYQKKIKELRQRSKDVQEALQRFVSRCHTQRAPGGSKLSAVTVLEGQANVLTEGLRELQRCTVMLLLRLSEFSREVHRPLGSSQQQQQQQSQRDHRAASPTMAVGVPNGTNAAIGSSSPAKNSTVRQVSNHTTHSPTPIPDLPPDPMAHPLAHNTPEGYIRFLREEERRIVHELRNMCARVRHVLKNESAVEIADAALLDTPLFLPSYVERIYNASSVFSFTKSTTTPTILSRNASGSIIITRPIPSPHSARSLQSAESGPESRKPSGAAAVHSTCTPDALDTDVVPFVGIAHAGQQDGGVEAGNARLVLGGGRRCYAMHSSFASPQAQVSSASFSSHVKSSGSASLRRRGVNKGGAGTVTKKVKGKVGTVETRTARLTETLAPSQVREAECVWDIICGMADTPLPISTAQQMNLSNSQNNVVEEARETSPVPTQTTIKGVTRIISKSALKSRSRSKSAKESPVSSVLAVPTLTSTPERPTSLSPSLQPLPLTTTTTTTMVRQSVGVCSSDEERPHERLETQPPPMPHGQPLPTSPGLNLGKAVHLSPSLGLRKAKDSRKEVHSVASTLYPREPNTHTINHTDVDSKEVTSHMQRCAVQKRIVSKHLEAGQDHSKRLKGKNAEMPEKILIKSRPLHPVKGVAPLSVEKIAMRAKMVTRIANCWRMYQAMKLLEKLRAQAAEKQCDRQRFNYESTMAGRVQRFLAAAIARRKFHEALQRHRVAPLFPKDSRNNIEDLSERPSSARGCFERAKKSRQYIRNLSPHSPPTEPRTQLNYNGHNTEGLGKSCLPVIPSLNLESHNLSTHTIDTYIPGAENFAVAVLHRLLQSPKAVLYTLRVMCEPYPTCAILALNGEGGRSTSMSEGKRCRDDSEETNAFSLSPLSPSLKKHNSSSNLSSVNSSSKRERDRKKQNGLCTPLREMRVNIQWELRPYRVVRHERMLAEVQQSANKNPTLPSCSFSSPLKAAKRCPLPLSMRVESFIEDVDVFHTVPIEKPFARPFERWGTSYAFQRRVFCAAAIYAWKLIFSHTPHDDYKQGLLKTREEQEARLARVEQRNRMILACYCVRNEKEWLKEASKDLSFVAHIWNPKKSLDPNDADFDRHCRETYEFVEDFLYQCFPTIANLEDASTFLMGAGIFFLLKELIECREDGASSCAPHVTAPSFASPVGAVPLNAEQCRAIAMYDSLDLLDRLVDWCRPRARVCDDDSRTEADGRDPDADDKDKDKDLDVLDSASWKDALERAMRSTAHETGEEALSGALSVASSRESLSATPDKAGAARRRVWLADREDDGGVRVQYQRGFLVDLSERLAYNLLGVSLDLGVCEDLDAVA